MLDAVEHGRHGHVHRRQAVRVRGNRQAGGVRLVDHDPHLLEGEAGRPQRERAAGREERLDAGVGEVHARDGGGGLALLHDSPADDHLEGGGSGGGVVADAFGVQEAPVGGVACLRHGGEVRQLFADAEVARLVDGGLGAERLSFLEVLPVLGLLAGQVEVGAGAVGDDLGAEGPGGAGLPRCRMVRPKTMFTLSGRPMPGLSRISCPEKIRPVTGWPGAMVVENPARLPDSCQR